MRKQSFKLVLVAVLLINLFFLKASDYSIVKAQNNSTTAPAVTKLRQHIHGFRENINLEDVKKEFKLIEKHEIAESIIETDMHMHSSKIEKEVLIYEKGVTEELLLYNTASRSYTYGDYFHRVSWILRSGVWSLSIYLVPADGTGNHVDYPAISDKEKAWIALKNRHRYDSQWVNARAKNATADNSMYLQYVCHADWAGYFKVPWNLEPIKPDKNGNYWSWVFSKCN